MDEQPLALVIPPCKHRGPFEQQIVGKDSWRNVALCMERNQYVGPVDCRICRNKEADR